MKIICIGRNYANHAKELGNQVPTEPVIFIKPETALNTTSEFVFPDFSKEIHFELELVLKINQTGKNISEKEANKFYNEIALGIDFTARDLQSKLKEKGLPWEIAKGFDGAAAVSDFVELISLPNKEKIQFKLFKNNTLQQLGNSENMIFSFDEIVAYTSQFFTLEKGDLIFTGTPEGVGEVKINDNLQGFLEDQKLLDIQIVKLISLNKNQH